jgi:hypothetical protein
MDGLRKRSKCIRHQNVPYAEMENWTGARATPVLRTPNSRDGVILIQKYKEKPLTLEALFTGGNPFEGADGVRGRSQRSNLYDKNAASNGWRFSYVAVSSHVFR